MSESNKDEIHVKKYPTYRSDFEIGSYELVEHRYNSLQTGPRSKLLPFLKGPMQLLSKKENKCTFQDIVSMREYDYHIKYRRVYNFDPSKQNPSRYAPKDDGSMYQVEKISKHKGDLTKSKNIFYS